MDGNISAVKQIEGWNLPDCDRYHQRVVWSNDNVQEVNKRKDGGLESKRGKTTIWRIIDTGLMESMYRVWIEGRGHEG